MKNASLLIHPEELSRAWIDRLVANCIPTLALHPAGGKHADRSLSALLNRLEEPACRMLLDEAAARGLRIEYEMHAARYLLPESEFAAHPEWFRMNAAGERVTDWNFCMTNVKALDYVAECAAKTVKRLYRSTDRYFLWLDDGRDSTCHCSTCRRYSPSDLQLTVCNHILRRLRRDNPRATLAYLAYCDTLTPPTRVKPDEGVFLEFAPFDRDFHRPLSEDGQSVPLRALLDLFGREHAKALDYWYDNSLFSKWKKPPQPFAADVAVMRADFAYYRKLGIEDIGCFACFLGEDYESLHGAVDVSGFADAWRGKEK